MKVRLYRPFSLGHFMTALPRTTTSIAVLDRTKEPGALGEPLYQDVVTALREAQQAHIDRFHHELTVIGGRYGLSSKEFTPAMVKAVFDELTHARPKRHFTVGINDDVTHLSLPYDADLRHRGQGRGPLPLLRPGRRRHGGREQELHQDHRRGHAQLRPGLLRLRLEEVGQRDRLATCASGRSRSAAPTWSPAPTSWPATSSASSRSTRCSTPPRRARSSCSTRRTRPRRSGSSCRARCRRRS